MAAALACLAAGASPASLGQPSDSIVWVVIGEAAASKSDRGARAGRQLFMAPDLLWMTLRNVKIARVQTDPVVVQITAGQQVCLTSVRLRAFDAQQRQIAEAPLSISVRQDQKDALQLVRTKSDICMRPAHSGEFPIRFTSLLAAPDGTTRGAQLFIRAAALKVGPGSEAD